MRRGICAALLLGVLSLPLQAQETAPPPPPPPVGMSAWAFNLAMIGAVSNVATSEIAFAHFGVYDRLIGRRVALNTVNLALPVVVRWALRKAPRAQANAQGVTIAAWAFFGTGQNVYVLVTVKGAR